MLIKGRAGADRIPGGAARRLVAAALAVAAVVPSPRPAAAQDAMPEVMRAADERAATTLELTAYAGLALPMSVLGAQGDTLQADLSTKPAFAAGLEFWFGNGFGIGVTGGLASPDLSRTTADSGTGIQNVTDLGTVDYLHGEALLLWRPQLRGSAAVLLPYFGAGAGVRRLGFDTGSGFEETTDITIALNAGTHVPLSSGVHLRLDVRDLISSYEGGPFEGSDIQHDLFVQVGLGFGL